VIVDTAVSLTGGRGQNPFFPTKAQIAIQTGFEVLRKMEAYVTIPNIHRLLLNEENANAAIETLMNKGDQRSHELVVALRDGFFGQPPEQLGGVQGTLSTYLEFFVNPEIAEVFCANEPTFAMDQIDAGKIVCIAMPKSSKPSAFTSIRF
jgi:type IV secretory pathway TraG/TraD family ATPase VirD4